MNWLIYIGGWGVGLKFVIGSYTKVEYEIAEVKHQIIFEFIVWTAFWVGICWRFIR